MPVTLMPLVFPALVIVVVRLGWCLPWRWLRAALCVTGVCLLLCPVVIEKTRGARLRGAAMRADGLAMFEYARWCESHCGCKCGCLSRASRMLSGAISGLSAPPLRDSCRQSTFLACDSRTAGMCLEMPEHCEGMS